MQQTTPERRHYFRVNQDVIFDFKTVDIHTAEQNAPENAINDGPSMLMLAELRRLDRDLQRISTFLNDKQRLLGDYLQKLNAKIDLIARHSLFASKAEQKTARVSIGEGGIAFDSERAIYKGNFLVLQIIFLPSYTPVITFAQVTRCDAAGSTYRIAAEFYRLQDSDRQELAKHVLKAQVSQRKRGSTSENNI